MSSTRLALNVCRNCGWPIFRSGRFWKHLRRRGSGFWYSTCTGVIHHDHLQDEQFARPRFGKAARS